MPGIKSSSIRDLKNRVSIYDVASRVVALKKAGRQFKGLSPFGNEKTPSFFISPDKNLYKCFSTGKAGDIISFVMETERLGFTEAVEALARRFNVELEYEEGAAGREDRSLRQEILEIHEQSADYFRSIFVAPGSDGEFIREYWTGTRDFPEETAEDFKIGFAPAGDSGLAERLWSKRYSADALRQCGLFYLRDEPRSVASLRPRFRGRLMIPIRDAQGRVIAFTARQTERTPPDDPSREAKYVNSPETPIFTKSHVLFNLDRARLHADDETPFLMVEGQLDAIRCWQVGLKQAVAPQGTSVTDGQLALLRRYAPVVECLLDGDEAGQKAALRLLPLAFSSGLEVRFLVLAPGEDPDELLRTGGTEAFNELRARARSAMAFAAESHLPAPDKAGPEARARASRELFELVTHASSEVARTAFLLEISLYLRLPPGAIQQDFASFLQQRRRSAPSHPGSDDGSAGRPASEGGVSPEHDLLLLCLHFEEYGPQLAHILPLEWIDDTRIEGRLLNRFLGEFEHGHWPGAGEVDSLLETDEERTLVSELRFGDPKIENPVHVANQGLRHLHARALEPSRREIELEIARKGANFDADLVLLLKKRLELDRERNNPPSLTPLP